MAVTLNRIFVRPLSSTQLLWASALLMALTTAYCLIYTALSGRSESPLEGMVWAALNIVPWLFCFEFAKRRDDWLSRLTNVAIFLIVMALLDALLTSGNIGFVGNVTFEITRRIPGAILVISMLLLASLLKRVSLPRSEQNSLAMTGDLPLLAHQISWVSAAGNYVELHSAGQTLLHRSPLSSVEVALADHGFVRIHRSVLVPRHHIKCITGNILTLKCGQTFAIGNRYRSTLA